MKMMRHILWGVGLAVLPFPALAKDKVTSPISAELVLLFAASQYHLANEAVPGKYYFSGATDWGAYFIVDLRRTDETLPADWVGSDLVGWFGVRKLDGAVVKWNVADMEPGDPIMNRPNHSAQPSPPRGG